jgi:hypothetical protein
MPEHSSIDAVTEILDGLYLGTFAYSLEWENPFNIEMVVNLCEDMVPVSAGTTVEWLPVSDGEAVPTDVSRFPVDLALLREDNALTLKIPPLDATGHSSDSLPFFLD